MNSSFVPQLLPLAAAVFSVCGSAFAATFPVINTNDSGSVSLRQAIMDANVMPGADTIVFDSPGADVHTITPLTVLPVITDPVIRAIGPSLSDFGTANPLLDPVLELHDANGALLTTNDNWKDMQQTEIEATGLAPGNDRESATLQTLAPGAYTAIVRGVADTSGVGLVEVYDVTNSL